MSKKTLILQAALFLSCINIGYGQVAISTLPELEAVPSATDVFPFVDVSAGVTKKVTFANLLSETYLESILDLTDIQGSVTDAQVPNNITIDLSTVATTANAGDSATSFFSSGTLENTLLDSDLQIFAGITPSANVQSLLGALIMQL